MKQYLFRCNTLSIDLASLLLRLILGGLLITHGAAKLFSYSDVLPMFPDPIGIGSRLSLVLVIFAEFFCSLFVIVGFATRLAVIPIFINMFVIFFIVHANDPFNAKELPFTFLLLTIAVFILGSGSYSLDRYIFRKKEI